MTGQTADTDSAPLFPIFMLSILVLFNVPYTIYLLCNGENKTQKVPWNKDKKKSSIGQTLSNFFSPANVVMVSIWVLIFLIFAYIQAVAKEIAPFDPFAILGVGHSADDKAVKKAYRQLSLKYHPDKNPDPSAQSYFAEQIAPAYKALTDEKARKNYEEFGHPDGPQGMNVGIALPQWMFDNGQMAPVVLAVLVGCGILLPLAIAVCYLMQSHKYTGNNVMQETLVNFMYSPHKIKESQGVGRMMETLVVAMEFITMPVRLTDQKPMEEMFKLTRRHMKDPDKFYKESLKTRPSVTKAKLLFLAQLEREADSVPAPLQGDLRYVLGLAPKLLEEMVKIALLPRRPPPLAYGWLSPSLGVLEFSQCLVQAVPVRAFKDAGGGGKGSIEGMGPFLQLPHMDSDAIKKLQRRKVKTLQDLLAMPKASRAEALAFAGLSAHEVAELELALLAVPQVSVDSCECVTDGEEGVMEEDIVSCNVRLVLRRLAHQDALERGDLHVFQLGDAPVEALAPHFPVPKVEAWWLILADTKANATLCAQKVQLNEAESAGMTLLKEAAEGGSSKKVKAIAGGSKEGKKPALKAKGGGEDSGDEASTTNGGAVVEAKKEGGGDGDGSGSESGEDFDEDDIPPGQFVSLKFAAPRAGKHDLTLYVVSDSWIGVAQEVPVRMKIDARPRSDREGRGERFVRTAEDSEGSEGGMPSDGEEEPADDYDSEESGTEESGSESEGGDDDDSDKED